MDTDILTVLIILSVTVLMLIFEILRIDIVAILCLLALGWTGLLEPAETLSGFSSNAVIAMLAVMIMGNGIAKTGTMDKFSHYMIKKAGSSRPRLVGFLSLSVGLLSGFMQNIGAAALFLPGVLNISRRGKIRASALIMPIGFAAILGGTITMVGSGPLILINDLLRNASLEPYGLFSVTPAGLALLISGIAFFLIFGRSVLPGSAEDSNIVSEQEKMIKALHLPHMIMHYRIPDGSPLIGNTPEKLGLWDTHKINILGITRGNEIEYAPWRETRFEAGQELAILGESETIRNFTKGFGLILQERTDKFDKLYDPGRSGFAEVIVPPRSDIIDQSIRRYSLRKRFAVEPVMLFSKGEEIRGDFSDHVIIPGDTIVVYGLWEKINEMKSGLDFVVATPFTTEKKNEAKALPAILCFIFAVALTFAGMPISIAFLSGAAAMVLTRVLTIQEAYQSVEWKVVFLLAGLIPLGLAMQKTGAATFLAEQVMELVMGKHIIFLVLATGILATLFSLFISNVGAIVVLAPLVMSIGELGGIDPRPLVLMAAVCAANSFILPTHQVNALLMSPGGYRNRDYFKAGGGMTLVFLVVVVTIFYLFYI